MIYLLFIYYAAIAFSILYFGDKFIKLIVRSKVNKEFDKNLGIETRKIRKAGSSKQYRRTESTPYMALDLLAERLQDDDLKFKDGEEMQLVDFGSGQGRVAIVLNAILGINATGVEVNETTYKEAVDNYEKYKAKNPKAHGVVSFENTIAQNYEFKENDNTFFFFNSFHVDIFKEMVAKIEKHAQETGEEHRIILYYPTLPFVLHLHEESKFYLMDSFKDKGALFNKERFSIYSTKMQNSRF